MTIKEIYQQNPEDETMQTSSLAKSSNPDARDER